MAAHAGERDEPELPHLQIYTFSNYTNVKMVFGFLLTKMPHYKHFTNVL